MGLFEEFKQTVETDEFKKWQEQQDKEDAQRLHCDLTTREGKIRHILDILDDLGAVVHTNAKRDEHGKLMYDEHGEVILLDGETEALIEDRAGFINHLPK